MTGEFAGDDLVIVKEDVLFNLSENPQYITKNCIVKVNSKKGAEKIGSISLPETFDPGADKFFRQQGRAAQTSAPFIYEFKILYFAARILKKDGRVVTVNDESSYKKVFWVEENGNRMYDYNYTFKIPGLEEGDILEYSYKIQFYGRYGYNLFYLHGPIAKQNLKYEVKYYLRRYFETYEVLCNVNGSDSLMKKQQVPGSANRMLQIRTFTTKNLKRVNYPVNVCGGRTLPYFYVDFSFIAYLNTMDATTFYVDRGKNFEWIPIVSIYKEKANYDSQHANGRKFLSGIPYDEAKPDIASFTRKICDTLNSLKFVSAESKNNNGEAQYAVGSGEWLVKGKLMEEFMYDLYWQLLDEKSFEKYLISVQDRRLGEHRTEFQSAPKYESRFFGVRNDKNIIFILPRKDGLKYNADELPFYYEGAKAVLMNYEKKDLIHSNVIAPGVIGFIQTASSTENENVRTESGMFSVKLDSMLIHASIKENLNGQFSTIIRPLYLKEAIDSTVSPLYFKKATDKPQSSKVNIRATSKTQTFPYKHSFVCAEDIAFKSAAEIPLKDWFSFTLNSSNINEIPNFDYYFDFKYTDTYNYMFQFDKPVEVLNSADLTKSISNAYFELSSILTKQTETGYLLAVNVKVKQAVLLQKDGQLLLDLVKELDALNNAVIKIK